MRVTKAKHQCCSVQDYLHDTTISVTSRCLRMFGQDLAAAGSLSACMRLGLASHAFAAKRDAGVSQIMV